MKVVIATNRFLYDGRCERICEIINGFMKRGNFEFYAFYTEQYKMEADVVRFIRVSSDCTLMDCLSYARYIVGDERFFLVLEETSLFVDPITMLHSHLSTGSGITVCGYGAEGHPWKNSGVFLLEGEYLDGAEDCESFEKDIVIPCAEYGELNVLLLPRNGA